MGGNKERLSAAVEGIATGRYERADYRGVETESGFVALTTSFHSEVLMAIERGCSHRRPFMPLPADLECDRNRCSQDNYNRFCWTKSQLNVGIKGCHPSRFISTTLRPLQIPLGVSNDRRELNAAFVQRRVNSDVRISTCRIRRYSRKSSLSYPQ